MDSALDFTYDALPGRVIFGAGAANAILADEVERLALRRVMVIASDGEAALAAELTAPVAGRVAHIFSQVLPHVPDAVAEAARSAAALHTVDGLLCVGGGSTTGTAKIVALSTGLPIIAVPTTYAGSEMTPVWGLTTASRKETGTDRRVLPRIVIYDPELTVTLPAALTVASGFNALAHCVEAFWAPGANPITALLAAEGISALARGLPAVLDDPTDITARSAVLYGAYLAGASFAVAGSGLHHKICHALGGAFNLPHAQTHAVVLPHVLAFNAPAVPDVAARIAGALGSADAVPGLIDLKRGLGAPESLAALGMTDDQLAAGIKIVTERLPIPNPRPVDEAAIAGILTAAFTGQEQPHDL